VIGHKMRFFVCAQYDIPGYGFLFSQSQRRISLSSSNHGILPNDSVNDSLTVVDPSHKINANNETAVQRWGLFIKSFKCHWDFPDLCRMRFEYRYLILLKARFQMIISKKLPKIRLHLSTGKKCNESLGF